MVALVEQKRSQIVALCRDYGVQRLELFGSAATDEDYDPGRSDLDFLVEFMPNHQLGPWLRDYFALKEELEQLLDRPVDLVMASALKNPYFVREVDRTRQPLYEA